MNSGEVLQTQFHDAPGATPLDPDEAAGLLPTHITTQRDLNAWEQINIVQGARWASRQKKRNLLEEGFIRDLHRQMFDQTWQWATRTLDGRSLGHETGAGTIDLGRGRSGPDLDGRASRSVPGSFARC